MKHKKILISVLCLFLLAGIVQSYRMLTNERPGGTADVPLSVAVIPFRPSVQIAQETAVTENSQQNNQESVQDYGEDQYYYDDHTDQGYYEPPTQGTAPSGTADTGSTSTDPQSDTVSSDGSDPSSDPSGGEPGLADPSGGDGIGDDPSGDDPGDGNDLTINENGEILLPEMP